MNEKISPYSRIHDGINLNSYSVKKKESMNSKYVK